MNQSKRQFIKTLPLVALGGIAVKAGEREVKAIEINPNKRYVFKVDADVTQAQLDQFRDALKNRGFSDALVIAGPVEIYEL